jgi:hypothetical protein
MSNINLSLNLKAKDVDITKIGSDELIACVKQALPVTGWMTALGTGVNAQVANVSVQDAWAELWRRSSLIEKTCGVNGYLTDAMKGRTVTFSKDEIVSTYKKDKEEDKVVLTNVGGRIVPEEIKDDPATLSAIAVENSLECILFAQDSDPTTKRNTVTTIDPVAAKEFDMPVYPIVTAVNGHHKAADIEVSLRKIEKETPGTIVQLNTVNMPSKTPKGKDFTWKGLAYEMKLSLTTPKLKNQDSLFQAIEAHRKVRGRNTGRKSLYSKGFYFGYMDNPTARAAHLILDLESLAHTTTIGRFLEIQQVDGIFNETVLNSLVLNGWVVVVRNGHIFDVHIVKSDEEKPQPIPAGVYRKIVGCVHPFFVFNSIDQQNPSIVKNSTTGELEVNLPSIRGRLEEFIEEANGKSLRIPFCYAYFRNEFKDFTKYLYPTSHAHSGFLIFCGLALKDDREMNLNDYFRRTLMANVYKTSYVYHRIPFWRKDPYEFDYRFNMTIKIKRKAGLWVKKDFDVEELKLDVEDIKVDYGYLRSINPITCSAMQLHNGCQDKTDKKSIQMVVDIMNKNDDRVEKEEKALESFTNHSSDPPSVPAAKKSFFNKKHGDSDEEEDID